MKRALVLVLSLVVAGCSSEETSGATTSTTTPSATTSVLPTTTTTAGRPTTTFPATAPTTVVATTTTSTLAGSWADLPLVTTGFGALGWWDGSDWVEAEAEGALPVVGGEDYQVSRLGSLDRTSGGAQTLLCEPLDLLGVELADAGLLGEFPGPYGVAISAPWPLHPHLVETSTDDGTYAGFAAQILSSRGLDVASPVIKQLVRTDLEGDGVNEVLVVVEEVTPGLLLEEGDYSLAFMRKVVEGNVETVILGETVVLGDEDRFGGSFTVGTVADLSGDGKMEVVLNAAFFEGFGIEVWEYVEGDQGPLIRLQIGCGS